jgi:hypothetical protein
MLRQHTPAEGKEVANLRYNLGNTLMDLAIQTDVQVGLCCIQQKSTT